ncbi:hypothetical protein [Xanthomonas arboricola]|uniref:hypothetical protein n=1 Tax=Xanthomonas arboricola TaxID=56448 RepID=UPI000AB6A4D9|nr:hypothetical protein [Xanthomonas arboricola]
MADSSHSFNFPAPPPLNSPERRPHFARSQRKARRQMLDRVGKIDLAATVGGGVTLLLLVLVDHKFRIVVGGQSYESSEIVSDLDALVAGHRYVASKGIDSARATFVYPLHNFGRLVVGKDSKVLQESVTCRVERAAVPNQCCEVVSEPIWKRVNSALGFFSTREQGPAAFLKRLLNVVNREAQALLPMNSEGKTPTHKVDQVEALWQLTDFIKQKPSDYSGVCGPHIHCLVVLLLRDLSCTISDLGCSLGRPVREQCDPHSGGSGTGANNSSSQRAQTRYSYSSPVSPRSPRRFERTQRYRHKPSLSQPILP